MSTKLTSSKKLELARKKTADSNENKELKGTTDLIDLIYEIFQINAQNQHLVFTNNLSRQIPRSYAANAFNAVRHSCLQHQIIRTAALRDRCGKSDYDMVSLPAIVNLLDDETEKLVKNENLSAFAHEKEFHQRRALKHNHNLERALELVQKTCNSPEYEKLMNWRDKHIAHNLETTRREKTSPIDIDPPKIKTLHTLLRRGQCIVNAFHLCLNQTGFDFDGAREMADRNAKTLWSGCTFNIKE